MDPSRTLITFLFHTEPAVQSVQLIGSWDNFSTPYAMERDLRRGQGEWKGCYTFQDTTIRSNNRPAKIGHGGLKMGATYYYYYELDGSTETFDANMPSTTACPSLPGQLVNTLTVPAQRSIIHRSASLSSMNTEDYRTMNPEAKFIPPRPSPALPLEPTTLRKRSAPGLRLSSSSSSTQSMVGPAWRRLFSNRNRDDDRGRSPERPSWSVSPAVPVPGDRSASAASSNRSRTRSISPESLRRFLSDDIPTRPGSTLSERPTLIIPDEIMEENDEDDDDFIISAVSETQSFATRLSPPPRQRPASSTVIAPLTTANLSSLTLNTMRPVSRQESRSQSGDHLVVSQLESAALTSTASSAIASPSSAVPLEEEMLTFYDDSNDDDEHGRQRSVARTSFVGYRLPENDNEPLKLDHVPTFGQDHTHLYPERGTEGLTVAKSPYLLSPIASGFGIDDFVTELGWAVDTIGNKPE